MSAFGPPQEPVRPAFSPDPFDAEMTPTGTPPMSGVAIAGFVTSLMVCCPVISPLLGLILSAVGWMQTREGQRSGRGFAVAGLVIALFIGLPLNAYGVYWLSNFFSDEMRLMDGLAGMKSGNIEAQVASIYAMTSARFQSSVSQADLAQWLQDEFKARGGLQGIAMKPQQPAVPRSGGEPRLMLEFDATFPDETVSLRMDIGLDVRRGRWSIEDVILDDQSVLQSFTGRDESKQNEPAPAP